MFFNFFRRIFVKQFKTNIMTIGQQIFEEVDRVGELLEGKLHIIDMSDSIEEEMWGEKKYKIYHSDGHCIDVFKTMSIEDEETGEPLSYCYDTYQEWDGFKEIDEKELLKILKEVK